ncbi:hypothetical protein JDV02_009175 [Purpureocillium takamizusanense]|uniref:Transcription factor domain-containing protein n=1 Tax=Purpureocillium takamizusanense TaxID=2060973 RepID=A0A9Q8QLJ5_9HYPO|nr:uncharacterized protein JDV02_009175 [Purpureocillium takamizusanense]UNI23349.1 hypothetical protein JDV02_009175 [Purpureocillium takamizusanense]
MCRASSRTAQIEERLNGLVNLLQASGEFNGPRSVQASPHSHSQKLETQTPSPAQHTPSGSSTTNAPPSSHPQQHDYGGGGGDWSIPPSYNEHAVPACICRPESGDAPPPPDSDDVLLDMYRRDMQPVFPFVIIPPDCDAGTLYRSRPFLMSAIRMVASFRSLRSMRAQMYHLMTHLADHMLIRSARSLDLLQGIIVMLGWYQYHCFMHAQMNNLLCLATSLVAELGLNRPPVLREQASLMIARPVEPPARTNEERRALAAVWFLTSAMATNFGRMEPMRYSSYLQKCVRELEASGEYDTDAALVFLVRVQHLTERIWDVNSGEREHEVNPGIPTAPSSAYILAFQNELDRLRNSLPDHLKMDNAMQVYIHTAMLRLYEPPVADMALIRQLSESLTMGSAGAGTPLDRIYQTSSALRLWFENWLSVPVSAYYRQPAGIAAQLVYALTMLGRWAKLATPRTMYEGGTPMPRATSAGNMSMAVYNADPQQPPATRESGLGTRATSAAAAAAAAAAVHGHGNPHHNGQGLTSSSSSSSQGPWSHLRRDSKECITTETEPGLPAAVGALQSQLQLQPGLTVNIPEILSAICSRFEQVNSSFDVAASSESGKLDGNIWSFSALKVRITRVKLERWAELVSAGAEASSSNRAAAGGGGSGFDNNQQQHHAPHLQQQQQQNPLATTTTTTTGSNSNGAGPQAQWRGSYPQHHQQQLHQHQGMSGAPGDMQQLGSLAQDQTQIQNFLGSTPWTSDMLDGIDPTVWFDGYLDWGAVVMNSMGTAEQ